jgi:3-hydroxyisobutyrate dehydrogenase-like beta-hydroxyacid dehydrogenase
MGASHTLIEVYQRYAVVMEEGPMATRHIGFIGLGAMGQPMATRLLAQGFTVVSCAHVRRAALDTLKPQGLTEVDSPRTVAATTDLVLIMVRDTAEAEAVTLGDKGVLAGLCPGAILVMMSTIDPAFCRRVDPLATARGGAFLEAPVSGGPVLAAQGTLALLVGGERLVLERCRAVLETLGRIIYCGALGLGMVAKLANNAVLYGTMGLVTEALAFGQAHGMSAAALLEVFQQASANSVTVQQWAVIQGMWEHAIGLGMKDVQICLDVAERHAIPMPLTAVTRHYPWPTATIPGPMHEGR